MIVICPWCNDEKDLTDNRNKFGSAGDLLCDCGYIILKSMFEKLAKEVADDFTIEVQSESKPHAIEPDNILVEKIQENAKQVMGIRPEPFGMGGGTFAKTLNLCDIAAVGFGPGDDEAFHVANERVEIKQLVDFACLISMISLDLLK